MHIKPYKKGIKLIPESGVINLDTLLQQPFAIYFLNTSLEGQFVNQEAAIQCGLASEKDAYGKTVEYFSTRETAFQALNNSKEVLHTQQPKFFDEEIAHKDGSFFQSLAIKIPWYHSDDKLKGLVGFSISLANQSLASSLMAINSLGIVQSPLQLPNPSAPILSKREKECLTLYAQGKTSKQIGRHLNLSYRTVENYFINIKSKLKLTNKSELIAFALKHL